jgi:cytochrome c oxidase cbb3-type subunit 3
MTDRSTEQGDSREAETTGHEWDGIVELNNPLPRWWLYIFYATIAFSVVYWILMPAWPLLPGAEGATRGLRGHSDRALVASDMAELDAERSQFSAALLSSEGAAVFNDEKSLQFALALGESVFGDNCATCHGSGGAGSSGYPMLADDVWLWGGDIGQIETTVRYGIRAGHPSTRVSDMPAFGRDGFLAEPVIADLTQLVLHFSGQRANADAVARALPVFEKECSSCHGVDGRGNREKGAPNLRDGEWLYGGDAATIRRTIYGPRGGVMPAWDGRLDAATIRAVSVYVHALGGGE